MEYDAIIIGAGPSGSAAATLLAKAGWSIALVEKQQFPRRKVCGECIAASNSALFELLGIASEFKQAAGPELRRVAVFCGARCVSAPLPAAMDPYTPWGRAWRREEFDLLLMQKAKAANVHLLQPYIAETVTGQAGNMYCNLRDVGSGETLQLRAPIVIGAYGSWQPSPANMRVKRVSRRSAELLAFKANFENADLEPGLLPVLSFEGGYGGMVVAEGGITTLACCIRHDRLKMQRRSCPGDKAGDVVEYYLRERCAGVESALRNARRLGAWLAAGPIQPGVRLQHQKSPIFLIGNAAGEAHPIVGEGISMALQSAWLLCDELLSYRFSCLKGFGAEDWHRRVQMHYAHRWRTQFRLRMVLAASFAQIAMRPAASGRIVQLLRSVPGLLTKSARWSGKVQGLTGEWFPKLRVGI